MIICRVSDWTQMSDQYAWRCCVGRGLADEVSAYCCDGLPTAHGALTGVPMRACPPIRQAGAAPTL